MNKLKFSLNNLKYRLFEIRLPANQLHGDAVKLFSLISSLLIASSFSTAACASPMLDTKTKTDLIAASKIRPESAVIWTAGPTANYSPNNKKAASDCFDWINVKYQGEIGSNGVFKPPPKTEFEKTTDYQVRVAAEKAQFELQNSKRLAENNAKFEAILAENLGDPYIKDVVYNADQERFNFNIVGGQCQFVIPMAIKVPSKDAVQLKGDLVTMSPIVVFEFASNKLTAKYVQLYANGVLRFRSPLNVSSNTEFTEASADKWRAKIQQMREQNQARSQQARQVEATRVNNTLWHRYLEAINVSGPTCDFYRSAIKEWARSGIEESQVNKLAQEIIVRANENGCVN